MNPFQETRADLDRYKRDLALGQIRSIESTYGPLKQRTLIKLDDCKDMPIMTRVYMEELSRCDDELRKAQKMRDEIGL